MRKLLIAASLLCSMSALANDDIIKERKGEPHFKRAPKTVMYQTGNGDEGAIVVHRQHGKDLCVADFVKDHFHFNLIGNSRGVFAFPMQFNDELVRRGFHHITFHVDNNEPVVGDRARVKVDKDFVEQLRSGKELHVSGVPFDKTKREQVVTIPLKNASEALDAFEACRASS